MVGEEVHGVYKSAQMFPRMYSMNLFAGCTLGFCESLDVHTLVVT